MGTYRMRKWLLCLAPFIFYPVDSGFGRTRPDFRMIEHLESIEKQHRLDTEYHILLSQWETLRSCHPQNDEKMGHFNMMHNLGRILPILKATFSLGYRPWDDLFSSSIEVTWLKSHKRSIFFSLMVTWDLYRLLQPIMENSVDTLVHTDHMPLDVTSYQLDVLFGQLIDLMRQYQDLCASQGREKTFLHLERAMAVVRIYLLEIMSKCRINIFGFHRM